MVPERSASTAKWCSFPLYRCQQGCRNRKREKKQPIKEHIYRSSIGESTGTGIDKLVDFCLVSHFRYQNSPVYRGMYQVRPEGPKKAIRVDSKHVVWPSASMAGVWWGRSFLPFSSFWLTLFSVIKVDTVWLCSKAGKLCTPHLHYTFKPFSYRPCSGPIVKRCGRLFRAAKHNAFGCWRDMAASRWWAQWTGGR